MVAFIIADDRDLAANAVVDECAARSVDVVRFDLSDYPVKARVTIDDFTRSRTLSVRGRDVDLEAVDAILYSRPTNIVGPVDNAWDPVVAATTIAGALYSTDCLWINRPDRDLSAGFKPYQLHLARKLGLRTPRTVLTNDPGTIREIASRGWQLVFKVLHGAVPQPDGSTGAVMTTVVTDDQLAELDRIRHSPCMFQEYVAKQCEVRLTVVGQTAYPVTIDSQSQSGTAIDWRAAGIENLPYGEFRDVPQDVLDAVLAMMRRLGIVYGAFDFIIDGRGDWVFLEVNPQGQYHWIEQDLGLPVSAAFAELLARGSPTLDESVRVVGY